MVSMNIWIIRNCIFFSLTQEIVFHLCKENGEHPCGLCLWLSPVMCGRCSWEYFSEAQGLSMIKTPSQTSRYEQLLRVWIPVDNIILCDHGYTFSFWNVLCTVTDFCTLTGLDTIWDHLSWSDSIKLSISQWLWSWPAPLTLTLTNHLKIHNEETKRGQNTEQMYLQITLWWWNMPVKA